MLAFINDLTPGEKALLSRQAMMLLDEEFPKAKGAWPWDDQYTRLTHEVDVEGQTLSVQGFSKSHITPSAPRNANMDDETFSFMAGLANFQPDLEANRESKKANPSFGLLSSGRTNSTRELFDHPTDESRPMRLSLTDATVDIEAAGDPEAGIAKIRDGFKQWEINLSGSQYLRMLRGEYTCVPCTITRSFGYLNDSPDNSYLEPNRQSKQVYKETGEITTDLKKLVQEACDLLSGGAITTKKKLNLLSDLSDEIDRCWAQVQQDLGKITDCGIESIKQDFQRRLTDQLEHDAHLLSEGDSKVLIQIINDL